MSSSFNNTPGLSPQTMAAVSMRNKIFTDNYGGSTLDKVTDGLSNFVGALSNFAPSQSRSVQEVRGIGMGDRILEAVPNYHDMFSISVSRTLFYLSSLFDAFGYKASVNGLVRALHHHKHPFRIRQELIVSEQANVAQGAANAIANSALPNGQSAGTKFLTNGLAAQAIITHYLGCWFTDYNTSYTSDSSLISEEGTINCPEISDGSSVINDIFTDTGNVPNLASTVLSSALSSVTGTGGLV